MMPRNEQDTPGRSRSRSADCLHASCVALDGRAVLITGRAGAGKSALALDLMAHGCLLVADDRTELRRHREAEAIEARCPAAIRGRIEARGVGVLVAQTTPSATVALVVDMDRQETERLPPFRETVILGVRIPLLRRAAFAQFPVSVLQYLKGGRQA